MFFQYDVPAVAERVADAKLAGDVAPYPPGRGGGGGGGGGCSIDMDSPFRSEGAARRRT